MARGFRFGGYGPAENPRHGERNVLVPLPAERTPLATDPTLRAYVQAILNAYPDRSRIAPTSIPGC